MQRWKRGLTNVPYVLQELVIWQFDGGADLITLLDAFAGQPLKKFLFIHLDYVPTVELIANIANAFPQLRELTLINEVFLDLWSGDDVVRVAFSTPGCACLTLLTGCLWPCAPGLDIFGTT